MTYIEILLGIAMAAIPGPIFFEVLRRSLTVGFWHGALVAVGEFLANITILMLIFFGISQFLMFKSIKMIIFLIGGTVLIWVGTAAVKIRKDDIENDIEILSREEYIRNANNSIYVGFKLAITSPLTHASLISISTYLIQYNSITMAFIEIIIFASGYILFFFTLALLTNVVKQKISTENIVLISKIFGVILMIYGTYFLYQFYKLWMVA